MNLDDQNFSTQASETSTSRPRFYRPADIGKLAGWHRSTIAAIGDQLFPNAIRLSDGGRLYSEGEKEKILAEVARRELESFR